MPNLVQAVTRVAEIRRRWIADNAKEGAAAVTIAIRRGGAPGPVGIALVAMAGASIEYYDFFIYATAATLIFPTHFFSRDLPPVIAQLAAFSTFSVGFIARPLGGIMFGHMGDLFGRRRALSLALIMMGVATTLVGVLPTYEVAGAFSAALLILLRFIQGLAVGGQWGGAALLAIENAPATKRGLYGSFVQIGVPVGIVLANGAFFLLDKTVSPADFEAWGWRLPFLFSVVLVFLGLYVKRRLQDSPGYPEKSDTHPSPQKTAQKSPILVALRDQGRTIALAGGAFIASSGCFYLVITYAVSYGINHAHVPRGTMLLAIMLASVLMMPGLAWFAALSDRFGRAGLYMWGAALTGLVSFALFPVIDTGSAVGISLVMIATMATAAMMYGPQAALFAELFDQRIRYSGASLGYQLGSILGGGFAPIIATALYSEFATTTAIAAYMAAMCAVSLACTAALGRLSMASKSVTSSV
jgi:MFS family permease